MVRESYLVCILLCTLYSVQSKQDFAALDKQFWGSQTTDFYADISFVSQSKFILKALRQSSQTS